MYLDVKINNVPVQLEVKTVGPASLEDIDEFREKLKAGDLVLIDQRTLNLEEENVRPNPYFDGVNEKDLVSTEESVSGPSSELDEIPNSTEIVNQGGVQSNGDGDIDGAGTEPIKEDVGGNEESEGEVSSSSPDTGNNVSSGSNPISQSESLSEPDKPNLLDIIEDVQEIFEENKDPEVSKGMKPWWKSKTIISNVLAALGCVLGVFVSDDPQNSMYLPATIVAFINLYLRSVSKNEIKLPMEDEVKGRFRNFRKK